VEYWPILDPTGMGEGREERLGYYRKTRDMILAKIVETFGPARSDWMPPG
jgi:arsenate reductase